MATTLLQPVTSVHCDISQCYLEDIAFREFKRLGFELNSLPWLGLDGVDALVVVIVVHRKVGGQQSALSARDRIPTLSWKQNHNNNRLIPASYIRDATHSTGEPQKTMSSSPLYLPTRLLTCPFVCLSIGLLMKVFFFFKHQTTCSSASSLYFSPSVCLSSSGTETNPPVTLHF